MFKTRINYIRFSLFILRKTVYFLVTIHDTSLFQNSAKKGVRQGCVHSPYLFNILAEMVRPSMDFKVDYKLEGE